MAFLVKALFRWNKSLKNADISVLRNFLASFSIFFSISRNVTKYYLPNFRSIGPFKQKSRGGGGGGGSRICKKPGLFRVNSIWFQIICGSFLLLWLIFCYHCVKLNIGVCMPYVWSWTLAEGHISECKFFGTLFNLLQHFETRIYDSKNLIHTCNQFISDLLTSSNLLSNAIRHKVSTLFCWVKWYRTKEQWSLFRSAEVTCYQFRSGMNSYHTLLFRHFWLKHSVFAPWLRLEAYRCFVPWLRLIDFHLEFLSY